MYKHSEDKEIINIYREFAENRESMSIPTEIITKVLEKIEKGEEKVEFYSFGSPKMDDVIKLAKKMMKQGKD